MGELIKTICLLVIVFIIVNFILNFFDLSVISLIRNIWHSDFVQNQLWDVWAIVYDLLA